MLLRSGPLTLLSVTGVVHPVAVGGGILGLIVGFGFGGKPGDPDGNSGGPEEVRICF